MPIKDRNQRIAYQRLWYSRLSKEERIRRRGEIHKRRYAVANFIASTKMDKRCSCGESHPSCLDFHHLNDDKEINISQAARQGWSIKRISKEIEKCELICSNCHRKRHSVRFP